MRRPRDWTASSACFDVAYIPLSCRKASTQCSISRDKRRSPFSLPTSKSLIRTVRGGHHLHFYLTDCFFMQPNQYSHSFFKICTLVRSCPKLQTMPHVKGTPGTTAGTVHHCPGRKIGSYVKLGPCRGKQENGYCLTHQLPCLAPECRKKHWAKLKYEPCSLCEQRQKVNLG